MVGRSGGYPRARPREQPAVEHIHRSVSAHCHLAAKTRSEASDKRNTVGRMWLTPGTLSREGEEYAPGTLGAQFATMRSGCIADDHLFPPSMKLARR